MQFEKLSAMLQWARKPFKRSTMHFEKASCVRAPYKAFHCAGREAQCGRILRNAAALRRAEAYRRRRAHCPSSLQKGFDYKKQDTIPLGPGNTLVLN